MTLPAHFRLAPSSAYRWLRCPGSARNHLPDDGGEEADEGTLAHAITAAVLLGHQTGASEQTAFQRLPFDTRREMAEAVAHFVEFVEELPGTKYIETKIVSIIPEHGGTVDVIAATADTIHVVDFKFGLFPVRAAGNDQIKCYLNLARQEFPKATRFFGSIVQPRVKPPETVEFSSVELNETLIAVIEARDDSSLRAGAHCRFCPLLLDCETAAAAITASAQADFTVIETLTDRVDRLARMLEFAPVAASLANRARAALMNEIQAGGQVPGYRLAMSRGKRRWKDEDAALEILKAAFPDVVDYLTKRTLKSPAQVEKMLPAADRAAFQALDLWEVSSGTAALVREDSLLPSSNGNEFDEIPS